MNLLCRKYKSTITLNLNNNLLLWSNIWFIITLLWLSQNYLQFLCLQWDSNIVHTFHSVLCCSYLFWSGAYLPLFLNSRHWVTADTGYELSYILMWLCGFMWSLVSMFPVNGSQLSWLDSGPLPQRIIQI